MPHTTRGYRFEDAILEWVVKLAPPALGDFPTVLIFVADQRIERIYAWRRGAFDHAEKDRLADPSRSWLFYDPFEPLEYWWLSWNKIDRPTMEGLIGSPLSIERSPFAVPSERPMLTEFPAGWGVMF